MSKKMKRVEVVWIDATADGEVWSDKKCSLRLETVTSIGYIKEETKNRLVMIGDYTRYKHARMHAIPKSCIKSIKQLK